MVDVLREKMESLCGLGRDEINKNTVDKLVNRTNVDKTDMISW